MRLITVGIQFRSCVNVALAAVLVIFAGSMPAVRAATIAWNSPFTIAGDADVSTNGSLVYACDISGAAATVNTVFFAGSFSGNITVTGSAGSAGNSFAGGTNAPWSGLSTNYQTVLQGGYYAANNTALSVTLGGLTVGHSYSVQLWASDSRSGGTTNRTETVTSSGGNTVTLAYNNAAANGGVGQYAIGTFTTDATTQAFTMTGAQPAAGNSAQLNAIQVRDQSAVAASTNSSAGVVALIDPTVALTNYTSLGEWNTNGNLDGWNTSQISGATVAGGVLSGTTSGNDPQVTLTGLSSSGPDLDLAFNDYLDFRLQLPAGFSGGIQVYFGAANNYYGTANATTGFSLARTVAITNVPTDGAFHVYRVFFGPQVFWRGNLSDVRIDPLGTSAKNGQAFALDYVRVGDLAGDVYYPSYASNVPGAGTNDVNGFPVQEMSSKHFRFCWDASVASNSYWTATMPHGTLRNFEEVWKTHVWRLGFPEPTRPLGTALPYTGKKYKLNVTTWNGGYWTGADGNGIPWVNITPDGLQVDPPTWVPPHEFTHACQEDACTTGYQNVDGQFWENNANYGREQWLYWYPWNTNQSGLDPNYADMSHFWIGYGNDYYLCWPFWVYLDENPDNLPGLGASYGNFFSTQIWKSETSGEYLWTTLARLAPGNSVQDIIGYIARRNVMWDYSHRTALTNAANAGDSEHNQRWTFAELRQRPDDPSWWQTPLEFAPQQTGYKIIRLNPQGSGAGRVVSVNFHGLPDSARGADWRASFVVVSDTGAVRYSALWNAGTNSVTLAANENTLYLSVAGTPTNFLAESIDEAQASFQSSPAKARFPFEIQITGTTPNESTNGSTSGLVQVANGGGWRASTATVDATAYVGPNARVLGSAKVRGTARILDYAIVEGSAVVTNNSVVSGHALVRDTAVVKDFAKVRDYAMVTDNSVVANYARILQHAEITGGSVISNWATVKGSAVTWHDNTVSTGAQAWNDAVLDGDFSTAQSCSNGFQFGFEEYNPGPLVWINNRTAPRRLFAAYEFTAPHDSLAKDWLGVTHGYLQGGPAWISSDGQRSGFLAFNGANQFVTLDRSLSDLKEITVTAWVKWSGGAGNQPVWYFGTAATNCMFLTPNDGTGSATFSITSGGVTQTLAWTNNALPIGVWTHAAVALSNSVTGRLYINGTNVATANMTISPDQLNAPNVNTSPQQNYLARGAGNSLPFLQGAIDGVHVYTGPLTDAEIAALQPPPTFSGPGPLYVDLRTTNAASSSLALFSTWTNFGTGVGNFTKTGSPSYSTNVAGTGVPGIYFDGASALYSSTNTYIAAVTGAGARSIEVWAYNPSLASEETMVSLGDRTGTRKDCAFNFGNAAGWGAVTHFGDDVPWGAMGFPSTSGWHHLVYTYDGNVTVKIYADGQLWFTDTLGGTLATPTGDPINIGCQRASGGGGSPGQYFSGYINAVRVRGGVLNASLVQSNFLVGPYTLPATAKSISLAAISNRTVNCGVTVVVTNSATDPSLPPLPLIFSLLNAPTNALIDPVSGMINWRPLVAQANTTNTFRVMAADNGPSSLTATQTFSVTVLPVSSPQVSAATLNNGVFSLSVNGIVGPDYTIQASTDLLFWTNLFFTNPVTLPFNWSDTNSSALSQRFYRVLLSP